MGFINLEYSWNESCEDVLSVEIDPHYLQKQLQLKSGRKIVLKINDNHSTFVSVKWEPSCTRVSVHRIFLHAPENVMQALACYVGGHHPRLEPAIRNYIDAQVARLDYSKERSGLTLEKKGEVHQLEPLFNRLNQMYFKNSLDVRYTWFGRRDTRFRSRGTLGLYHELLRLVKIHRCLDRPHVPQYVVSYVLYHEMLHAICPPKIKPGGIREIHTEEFHRQEQDYPDYHRARSWIKMHQEEWFEGV